MNGYPDVLKKVKLFGDINGAELESMLDCIGAQIKNAGKGEILLLVGNKPTHIGVLLSGQLNITRESYDGVRSMIAAITPGEIFAEALCCAGVPESPVTVVAGCESTVMLLKFSHILHTCPRSCSFHGKLIENMLELIAKKNLQLQTHMEIVGLKSIRARVIRYLESAALRQGRNITIPFNREELADFLCVERSALSHELARMKKDGLIDYRKNNFILK